MAVDPVREVVGLQRAYSATRGAERATGVEDPRTGQAVAVPNTLIPRTTIADVLVAAQHVNRYLDPNPDQCREMVQRHLGVDAAKAASTCKYRGPENPSSFVRTKLFEQAKKDFNGVYLQALGVAALVPPVALSATVFPDNERFWGYAVRYAIARSAAGAVPFWQDLAVESVREAVDELPDTVRKAVEVIDPRGLVPDVGKWAELLKWGSVLAGLGMLYYYVLRPKK